MKNIRAIILAAGRGSRMKNLTDDNPKCLVKLHNKALLHYQLESILDAGISAENIAIISGYQREKIQQQCNLFKCNEFHNERWEQTNMVYSLSCAKSWLKDNICIVSYSDIFYEKSAVELLINDNSDLSLTYDKNWLNLWQKRFENPLDDAETFKLDNQNYLLEIGNKPKSFDDIQGQYMGLLKFTPTAWNYIENLRSNLPKNESDNMHMTGTLQRIILENKLKIKALEYNGKWGEVDNENDLNCY